MKKKILIFGENGLVGSRFSETHNSTFEIIAPTMEEVNILDEAQIKQSVEENNPDIIINFAAYTNVDEAEKEKGDKNGLIYKLNSLAPKTLAEICKKNNRFLVHFSTSYVFDGTQKDRPYKEDDPKNPLGWYAKTKHFADEFIGSSGCDFLIIRIEMPYRSHYPQKKDLARFFLEQLHMGKEVVAVKNQKITPGFIDDIAHALAKIIIGKTKGIFHLGSTDFTTPYDFARQIAQEFNLDKKLIKECSFAEYHKTRIAPRSQYSWLDINKFVSQFGDGILHTNADNIKTFKKQIDTFLKLA
ncbi:NAD(P)-dependent oxidoreductase [Candidatus Daviesbacteria bacterium]|nr:NAD(P)-dependent oxidoreductase [Candidatus Daviesbacteria bacterium]